VFFKDFVDFVTGQDGQVHVDPTPTIEDFHPSIIIYFFLAN